MVLRGKENKERGCGECGLGSVCSCLLFHERCKLPGSPPLRNGGLETLKPSSNDTWDKVRGDFSNLQFMKQQTSTQWIMLHDGCVCVIYEHTPFIYLCFFLTRNIAAFDSCQAKEETIMSEWVNYLHLYEKTSLGQSFSCKGQGGCSFNCLRRVCLNPKAHQILVNRYFFVTKLLVI